MHSDDKVELIDKAHAFERLTRAVNGLGDSELLAIRNASVDDLVDARAAARAGSPICRKPQEQRGCPTCGSKCWGEDD